MITAAIAVVVGWGLSEVSNWWRFRRDDVRWVRDNRSEAYRKLLECLYNENQIVRLTANPYAPGNAIVPEQSPQDARNAVAAVVSAYASPPVRDRFEQWGQQFDRFYAYVIWPLRVDQAANPSASDLRRAADDQAIVNEAREQMLTITKAIEESVRHELDATHRWTWKPRRADVIHHSGQ